MQIHKHKSNGILSGEDLGFMQLKFSRDRRDMLKTTGTLVGAAALASVGDSLNAFAQAKQATGVPVVGDSLNYVDGPKKGQAAAVADIVVDAAPVTAVATDPATGQPRRNEGESDNATVLLYRVDPFKIRSDMQRDTVQGILCYSAVCTHMGCMLSDWDAPTKCFMCPCHDATFDPLQDGENLAGATSRTLPSIPIKAVDGKLVVAGEPSGYVGVKGVS